MFCNKNIFYTSLKKINRQILYMYVFFFFIIGSIIDYKFAKSEKKMEKYQN